MILLHRIAALYLRLRRKRVPLEDLVSAWSGGRWHMGVYRSPERKRRAG